LGKNRDRLSIIADVLEVAKQGANKTRIMFIANLSFNLLEKYLDTAVEAELVKIENSKYTLTKKGWVYLKQYQHFHESYREAQKMLEVLGSERERLGKLCQASQLTDSVGSVMDSE
jgi:predicted transcriptional regulator